jgi:hypothetical protein
MLTNACIYLIGFAGTGKLTIARELQKLAPFILVDNHLTNHVVFSLIEADGLTPLPRGTWEHVGKVRNVVFNVIRDLVKPDRNLIFTNELIEELHGDHHLFDRVAKLVQDRQAAFLPVRLLINPEELARRVVSPERALMHKSVNVSEALEHSQTEALLKPTAYEYFDLDVTERSAADAAGEILRHLKLHIAKKQERSGLRP